MDIDKIRHLRDTYRQLFNSDDGVVVLKDMQDRFHIHGTVFGAEPTDTAYREGQRTVVLFIQQMLLDWDSKEEYYE